VKTIFSSKKNIAGLSARRVKVGCIYVAGVPIAAEIANKSDLSWVKRRLPAMLLTAHQPTTLAPISDATLIAKTIFVQITSRFSIFKSHRTTCFFLATTV
jgi:hypothetical protein